MWRCPVRFDSFEHLLSHFAHSTPDAPALRYEGTTLSFAALFQTVQKRAEEMRRSGKSCLGVLCDGSLEDVIETLLGSEIVDENDTVRDMQQLALERWKKRGHSVADEQPRK